MGFGYKNFLTGIGLVPVLSTGVTLKGDFEVLDASGKLNYFNGASASSMVTEAHASTLTNKTFNAPDNTLTNVTNTNISASAAIAYSKLNLIGSILNADISASAAIAFSKLAALTANKAAVTNGSGFLTVSATSDTQISYLSTLTSDVQTQLNSKASTASPTFTGTIIAAAANFSGLVNVANTFSVTTGSELRLYNPTDTNYVGFKSGNVVTNTVWTMPLGDGTNGQVLKTNGVKVLDWVSVATAIGNSAVVMNTGNGYGVTGTKIRCFMNTESSSGSDISYVSDATNGDYFSINSDGIYMVTYVDTSTTGSNQIGISVNASGADFSTSIASVTPATKRKGLNITPGTSLPGQVPAVMYLVNGDTVRAHTDGFPNASTAALTRFEIRKVGV